MFRVTFLCRRLQSLACKTRGKVLARFWFRGIDPCVNLIFRDVLLINGLHVSIQIEIEKTGLYGVFLCFQTCIFYNFTKEKALQAYSG